MNPSHKHAERVYLLYAGANSLIGSMMFTVTTLYLINIVELNPLQLVLVGTVLELSVFLFEIPTGIVADLSSRKLSVLIGLVITGAAFVLEGAIASYAAVLTAQVLWALGYTFTSGADRAWIADELEQKDLSQVFLKATQVRQISALVGTGLGVLLGLVSVRLPLIVGGTLYVVLALALIFLMPETKFKPQKCEGSNVLQSAWQTFSIGARLIRTSNILTTALVMSLIYGLYSEGWDRLWEAHFIKEISFPAIGLQPVAWFGIINSVGILISIVTVQYVRKRIIGTNLNKLVWLLVGSNLVMAIGIVSFGLAGQFALALITYLVAYTSRKVNGPLFSAFVNHDINSKVRATVLSTIGQIGSFGQFIGGPILGLAAKQYSVSLAIICAGLILAPIVFMLAYAAGNISTVPDGE